MLSLRNKKVEVDVEIRKIPKKILIESSGCAITGSHS